MFGPFQMSDGPVRLAASPTRLPGCGMCAQNISVITNPMMQRGAFLTCGFCVPELMVGRPIRWMSIVVQILDCFRFDQYDTYSILKLNRTHDVRPKCQW
ncbi:hypothetical protein EV363DRAFT_1409853 [Boletus edulis]|nr:hypothetical protein EV363DRAFT_1409853 [Boletus edulis]